MRYERLNPMLETNDLKSTIEFYENVLKFQCVKRIGDHWARLSKDSVSIMFCSRFQPVNIPDPVLTGGLYLYVSNIDSIWDDLSGKTTISYPIETFDYGMREFGIYDCNGYLLQFGQEVK
jgi:uncharacterized glyoxalase superfamily protein PhnB